MRDVEWRETPEGPRAYYVDPRTRRATRVAWAPLPGSQEAFLECPVFEVLYEGNRGGGKTQCLLMDFAQFVGRGWGMDWCGVLFRQSYPDLQDAVRKTQEWFPQIFPAAKFNANDCAWNWPGGETLKFRYMDDAADYRHYHGHAYPWIGWEELTTWPDDACYRVMISCSRSTRPGMPRHYRATTNSYGVGHSWVKARWRLPILKGRLFGPIIQEVLLPGAAPMERVAIHSDLAENIVLLHAEPDYRSKIVAAASSDAQRRAWLEDSWDIVAGGIFDEAWSAACVVPDVDPRKIPAEWRIDRSYDHGQSRPFSVGWWAESNGEPIEVGGRTIGAVRGDVIRIDEWYGWRGRPNEGFRMTAVEVAREILRREEAMGIRGRVRPGPADSAIFDEVEPERSVAGDMARVGVTWTRADKRPGSRVQGWQRMIAMMKAAAASPREEPGLFVCDRCEQFRRTVPCLPRDRRNQDDVDSEAEDHAADETRYRLWSKVAGGGCRDL